MQPPSPDIISIEGLPVHTEIGLDVFGRSLPHPHMLAIHFHLHPTSLLLAAATDDSRFSIRYWDLESEVLERVNEGAPWTSGRTLARAVTGVAFKHAGDAVKELRVVVETQNGHPRATGGMRWELTTPHGAHTQEVVASAHGLELGALLGGVDQEQRVKQRIVMDLWFVEKARHSSEVDYTAIVNRIVEVRTVSHVMGRRRRVVLRGVGDRGIRISDIGAACP
jgi:dihydroneopterin aldolase